MSEISQVSFEKATREHVRFDTPLGQLTTEDLWDLPLVAPTRHSDRANLDDIARGLHIALKELDSDVSFVRPSTSPAKTAALQLKFDVVKHIIGVKVAERDAAVVAAERKVKREKILAALAQKEDQALSGASQEELKAMLESL